MQAPDERGLIYEWAEAGPRTVAWPEHVMLDDETLRDGLQSPSVNDPPLDTKLRILHLMEGFGIETADIGLPGAGKRQRDDVLRICREIADHRMRIQPNCAGRTLRVDIEPMVEVMQLTGVPMAAAIFIGSSPIRQYAEDWNIDHILRHTREAVSFAVQEGLEVMYVTEDTARSSPEHLRVLLTAAIDAGAKRLCICDTCGSAVPHGVFNVVDWVRALLDELGAKHVGIDWHGHRDRGLDLANTLAAIEAGATRVHGTALGIGERIGNTPMEQLLVNLTLLGMRSGDLSRLPEYVQLVADSTGMPVTVNTPLVGRDAFRTATGVHAAAVIKATKKGDAWLADRVYSGVPASLLGRTQQIEIGPMSGNSNVIFYLTTRGIAPEPSLVDAIMAAAKQSPRVLNESEVLEVVRKEAAAKAAAHA